MYKNVEIKCIIYLKDNLFYLKENLKKLNLFVN